MPFPLHVQPAHKASSGHNGQKAGDGHAHAKVAGVGRGGIIGAFGYLKIIE